MKLNKKYRNFIRFLKNEDAYIEFQKEYLRQHHFSLNDYVNNIERAVKDYSSILDPTYIFCWSSSEQGQNFWAKLNAKHTLLKKLSH